MKRLNLREARLMLKNGQALGLVPKGIHGGENRQYYVRLASPDSQAESTFHFFVAKDELLQAHQRQIEHARQTLQGLETYIVHDLDSPTI
jgi:hypothetical protein